VATSDGPGRGRLRLRLERYLYSNKNIAGCVGALCGLGLYLSGVVGALWPVVTVGLYGVGALVTPPPKGIDLRSGLRSADLGKAMDEQLARIAGKVPPEVFSAVQAIQASIKDVLPRRDLLPPGSRDAYAVEQTVLDYLPTALESYLRLPRAYANRVIGTDGRTAKQVLLDQLATLQREMEAVVATLARTDTDRLLAHERFLDDRFGRPGELGLIDDGTGTTRPDPPDPA